MIRARVGASLSAAVARYRVGVGIGGRVACASKRHLATSSSAGGTTPTPLPNPLVDPPATAYRPPESRVGVRKPEGHVPAVQRWSAVLGDEVVIGVFGVQGEAEALGSSAFTSWAAQALNPGRGEDAPCTADHARYVDAAGTHHVVTAYWRDPGSYARWAALHDAWWHSPDRIADTHTGVFREIMAVPSSRIETIYWLDYPGGIMRDPTTELYPTPYCGYYGAMRDRLGCAADDDLAGGSKPAARRKPGTPARARGRWRVSPPENTAVIRSAHTWQFMDAEQRADYDARLVPPLARGMDYLSSGPDSGCLSLRWHTTTDAAGEPQPEKHATAYFTDLAAMEAWAERHRTHAAIFGAATARYKHYGAENQLRTWHEVYILPKGQQFEYINCHPDTGVLPYFDAEQVA